MSTLNIRILNAGRTPLDDTVDVDVTLMRTNEQKARVRNHSGRKKLTVKDLAGGETYLLKVFPMRHRPVGRFVMAPPGAKPLTVDVVCPVHPQRVADVEFPDYNALDNALRGVLERSTLERDAALPPLPPGDAARSPGRMLYESLTRIECAGLMNLFSKMSHTPVGDVTAWSYVTDVYRVRGDRIFANVTLEFRDRVKNAQAGGGFKEAPELLHTPGPGFEPAGSFKTREIYGNLQLSFFSSTTAPLRFEVDADIDDAGGIEHAFQVLEHFFTHGETHPYDIHEILLFYQQIDPGYGLIV